MHQNATVDGYKINAQGHLIPLEQVRAIDLARDELVLEKVSKVKVLQEQLKTLKGELMQDITAFVQLSAERFGARLGGNKGNVSLMSYDGAYVIKRQMSENVRFDEGLQAAKELMDECLKEWSAGSPGELRAIVDHAFRVDKEGRINTMAILSLRRLNIKDDRWQRGMQAIADSLQVIDTKAYVRVYERDTTGKYQPISLDMAAL
ncbi:MAG: DUF3164 family protein [Bilophila sp.]